MAIDDEALRSIEAALLEAAVDVSRWPEAIARLVQATRCTGVLILPIQGRVPGVPTSADTEGLADSYFRDGWSKNDLRILGLRKLLMGGVAVDQDYMSPKGMERDPYYIDFLGKNGFKWYAGLRVDAGTDIWTLTFQRTPKQGLFSLEEQESLARLIAPISRLATFSRRLAEARTSGMVDTLEAMKVASFLVDRTGRVVRVNDLANRIIGADLTITNGKLSIPNNSAATRAVNDHIMASLWIDISPSSPFMKPVVVQREGRRPLVFEARNLRGVGAEFFQTARALVHITDLENTYFLSGQLAKQAFGLTEREILVAGLLVKGTRPERICLELGISYETVRTHLKSIFAKTDTSSQSELVLLLSKISGGAARH